MWWIAVVAAVGAALLAACLGSVAFLLWRRRYGHRRRGEAEGQQLAANQVCLRIACLEEPGRSREQPLSPGMPRGL